MGNSKSKLKTKKVASVNQSETSSGKTATARILAEREYHNDEKSTYVLPKDDQEKDRLHEQHFLLKEKFGGNLLMPEVTGPLFEKELNVLDAGCGPATWLLELSTEYPSSQFYDVFPEAIHPPNLKLEVANILTKPLPFDVEFDFVQMRLFSVGLRGNEWKIAFQNVHDTLKTGGLFQSVEGCPLLETSDPDLQVLRGHLGDLLRKKGQDPDIASQLDTVLKEVGFEIIYKKRFDMPLGHGTKADIRTGDSYKQVLIGMAPFMAAQMQIDVPTYIAKVNDAASRLGSSQSILPMWTYIARRID
ncbi:hypothetical protein INT43_002392 [Umbelopsis isabellina]|uniref:Methyltransferase domain-containing protein n=1 Tax=Mortierella isabellina TaxID=91625 RepID=A0A8H7Q3S2_MORIS|nr:hypothetical protein INT43_002392 [Umbelopsis isabellina]